MSAFSSVLKGLSWGIGSNIEKIKSFTIKLPTKVGKDQEIDFEFMESFISEVEETYIIKVKEDHRSVLATYLKVVRSK